MSAISTSSTRLPLLLLRLPPRASPPADTPRSEAESEEEERASCRARLRTPLLALLLLLAPTPGLVGFPLLFEDMSLLWGDAGFCRRVVSGGACV